MASLPEVGLQAVIANLPGFEAGAKAITNAYDTIEKKASNVEKATNILGGSFSSLSSPLTTIGNNVLSFAGIAAGVGVAGVAALSAGFVGLAASALQPIANFERMSLSIENLVAREISGGQVIEQATQARISLSEKESKELEKLKGNMDNEINDRVVLAARIEEQKERIRQLTAQYGDNGLVVIKERAELQGMQLDLQDLSTEIDDHQSRIAELTGKDGQLVTTLEKVRVGQISMSDALEQAAPRAQELIKWIQILAIQSPFTSEGIQAAFQTALAYGFTTEQAQRLTEAEVDFTVATGKSAQSADLIALALGQIQARGKVLAQELRQLSEQGVGTNRILEDMGFTLDDVSNGLVPVDEFIEAVIQDMEIFKGAAKDQATTFSGLVSSLQEVKDIALREFFTGTFNAIRPYLAEFVDFLTAAAFQTGSLRQLGDVLAQNVLGAIRNISIFTSALQAGGLAVFSQFLGVDGIALWYELKELVGNIALSVGSLSSATQGQLIPIWTQLSEQVIPAITSAIAFVNDHFVEFQGALLGIGAVLAAGVFAAVIAGVLSLLTPVNLIIAAAALLGAAWAGNWGGIQEKTAAVWAFLQPILTQLWTWLQTNIPLAIQFLANTWDTVLFPAITAVWEYISGVVIPGWAELAVWLQDNLPVAIQVLSDFWTETLLPALTAVWTFWNDSLFPAFAAFIDFLGAVAGKALEAWAGLWQNVLLPAIKAVNDFIIKNITPVFEGIASIINDNVNPAVSELTDGVFPPFTEALDTIQGLLKDLTGTFKGWADAVRNFQLPDVLVRHSPSPFEEVLYGVADAADAAAGGILGLSSALESGTFDLALGIDRSIVEPLNIAGAAFDDLEKHLDDVLSGAKSTFALNEIKPELKANIDAIIGSDNPIELINQLVEGAVSNWEKAGISLEQLGDVGNVFWNSFLSNAKDANIALRQMLIDASNTAISIGNSLTGVIDSSVALLNSRIEQLQGIVVAGSGEFEGQILDAVQAQELLNDALADQAAIQDDLLETASQQAQLDFLQQQLDLITLVQDAGLDAGEVLGGLTLGLDASIPDLVAATNAVIQAMIDQVNADLGTITDLGTAIGGAIESGVTGSLGIASPSKVMAGLADNAMSSFVNTALSWGPAISRTFGAMVAGPTMVAAPALAGASGGAQTVINANFGGNNISGGMDQAQFDAMVLRSIQRLMT